VRKIENDANLLHGRPQVTNSRNLTRGIQFQKP
jgi:hypothetical protein